MTSPQVADYLTIADAAAVLRITPARIRWSAKRLRDGEESARNLAGRLRLQKPGRDWIVPRQALVEEQGRRASR